MLLRTRSTTSTRPGVAATELAIWLPFLLLMFAVSVDFCRIYYATQTVQNCADAAAMYASGVTPVDSTTTNASDAAVQAAVAEGVSLSPPLQASNVAVSYTGGVTQVTVTYDFAMLTRLPGLAQTVTISRTVKMTTLPASGT